MTAASIIIPSKLNPPRTKKGARQPNRSIKIAIRGIPTRVLAAQLYSIRPITNPRLLKGTFSLT